MSDNKFIKRLKGEQTAKSVLEIKNESAKTSFANMPQGTSNAINVYSDHRGNATAVLNGTINWKVSNSELLLADTVFGDGQDFISTYSVSGAGLWVNASYTFPSTGDPNHPVAAVFNPGTKWVLKVCGDNLIVDGGSTVNFTMLVKIGTANVYSKNFTIRESAGQFSKEFVIDFGEANSDIVKAGGLSTLTIQLLCGTANASARIYNGMTVLTCLQRKVDASAVSSQNINVQDVLDGNIVPSDYFSNPEFIDQIEDGEDAYAVFTRDGDDVNLSGWTPKNEVARKEEIIVKSNTIPTASADLVGFVYQYVGETNQTYEHGYIYECKAIPADTLVFSPDTVSCSWTDLSAFLQTETADYNSVVAGTMTYVENAELWRLVFTDANGDTVLTYQQYTADWEDVGFTFNDIFHDGDIVSFTRYTDSTQIWERIDVQPNHNEDIAELQDEIANLKGLGRFLSVWNCTTGLAETNPPQSPYTYHTGDYFLVGTVGATNYRPDGSSYTIGVASTTVETNEVKVNDVYIYDGTNWKLQANSQRECTFSGIVGSPYDNTNLSNALNGLQGQITTNKDTMDSHIGNTSNPHNVTKAQVGLGNVDNTSDLAKPISTATQTALNAKANIADLATVATSGSYNDLSNKPTIPAAQVNSDWNATGGVAQILNKPTLGTMASESASDYTKTSGLAAVATSGSYTDLSNKPTIPTVGDGTITITQGGVNKGTFTTNQGGDTTIELEAGGGSIDAIDNLTITKNSDDEIQAVATINANTATGATNPIYDWVGTLAEYNAQNIETLHPDWVCFITDDVSDGASVYTKTEVDNNFVGKGHEVIAFQAPTAANNYTWYRKYADGWVEQGGHSTTSPVTYPLQMANTNYTLICVPHYNSNTQVYWTDFGHTKTTTGFSFRIPEYGMDWQVSGMAAN